MSIIREKEIIKEILEKLRDLPLLWDQSHGLYNNKVARKEAYEKLLEMYRLCEPGAQLNDLKKKIDNMRTTYKREHGKVIKARVSGELEYVPTLWYYNSFSFLNDDENDVISCKHSISTYDDEEEEREDDYNILKSEEYCNPPPPNKKKKKSNIIYLSEDVHDHAKSYEVSDQPSHNGLESSSTESFGKTIGLQLNELKPLQRFIAEKLMSEVIFYGRLDKLQPSTGININQNDH